MTVYSFSPSEIVAVPAFIAFRLPFPSTHAMLVSLEVQAVPAGTKPVITSPSVIDSSVSPSAAKAVSGKHDIISITPSVKAKAFNSFFLILFLLSKV